MSPSRDLMAMTVVSGLLILNGCGSNPKPQPLGEPLVVPDRKPLFTAVTETYGALRITTGDFDAEADKTPWSSWWYPASQRTLFDQDGNSPLEKYDTYVTRVLGQESSAAAYERDHLFDPSASPWEGLCNAWSAAAVSEPEPSKPAQRGGVTFQPSDLKALIVKSYEQVQDLKQFGQRFDGRREDDFDDIYPDQFHKLLQSQLFEKHRAFIIDKDPGVEVWNVPIYRASVSIAADTRNEHLLHVDTWVTWADSISVDPGFLGTKAVTHEYTYDLYGTLQADGSYEIKYGEWTGDSLDDHPDFGTVVPEHPVHSSLNAELKTDIIAQILATSP